MNIKNALWKLQQVGECSILDAETREAAKLAAESLNNIFLQFDMSATAELSELQVRVYELANAERNRAMLKLSGKV